MKIIEISIKLDLNNEGFKERKKIANEKTLFLLHSRKCKCSKLMEALKKITLPFRVPVVMMEP